MKTCIWYEKDTEFCLCHLADGRVPDCQYEGNPENCPKPDSKDN